MIFKINERFQITSDRYGWQIRESRNKRSTKTGKAEQVFEPIRYYATLEAAARGLADLMVRTSEAVGAAEVLAEVKNVLTTLSRALSPQFEVTQRPDTANPGGSK